MNLLKTKINSESAVLLHASQYPQEHCFAAYPSDMSSIMMKMHMEQW